MATPSKWEHQFDPFEPENPSVIDYLGIFETRGDEGFEFCGMTHVPAGGELLVWKRPKR